MRGFRRHLRSLLARLGLRRPQPDPEALAELTEESLGRLLLWKDSGLGLFRLVHLLDAVTHGPAPRTMLSVGSGLGTQEAFLALRFPDTKVFGVDLRRPKFPETLPNLRFMEGDLFDPEIRRVLPEAEFVFSIECLEHIENDEDVFALMVSKLRPGGRLLLLVPFASEAELADPGLCRSEREEHGHVRPGYSAERLRRLVEKHHLTVERIAAAYRFPLQPFVAAGVERLSPDLLLPRWRDVMALLEMDLRDGLAASRSDATVIKLLARRPGSP